MSDSVNKFKIDQKIYLEESQLVQQYEKELEQVK